MSEEDYYKQLIFSVIHHEQLFFLAVLQAYCAL